MSHSQRHSSLTLPITSCGMLPPSHLRNGYQWHTTFQTAKPGQLLNAASDFLRASISLNARPFYRSSWIPLSRLSSSPIVMGVSHGLAFGSISPGEGPQSRIYYSRSASTYNSSEKDKRAFSTINKGRCWKSRDYYACLYSRLNTLCLRLQHKTPKLLTILSSS